MKLNIYPHKLLIFLKKMNHKILTKKKLSKINFGKIGKKIFISTNVTIIGANNIYLGNNVRIDDYSIISAKNGKIIIGSNVHIGGQTYLGCAGTIVIKNNVNIAQGCKIYSLSDDYLKIYKIKSKRIKGTVTISNNVIIGSNSVIVGKCTLNDGSAVGALSFVNKDLKKNSLYAGQPVKFIRKRTLIK